jgi:multiple antibiotic resistance protein
MRDALRLAVFVFVLLDPTAAAIGAATLAKGRRRRARTAIVVAGGSVAFAVLALVAVLADPVLDWLRISPGAAELAAGLVVIVPALDLLWQGPGGRVAANPAAQALRLGCWPYGVPLLAGPAAVAAVIAWAAAVGRGATVGGSLLATLLTTVLVGVWTHPPRGRTARAIGAFTAVAMALVAFDLIHDGVFGP